MIVKFALKVLSICLFKGRLTKKETSVMLKELGYYSSLGLSVALSIFIGLYIGLRLDRWLGTAPWFMFIFFGLGIAAAMSNILLALRKSKNLK